MHRAMQRRTPRDVGGLIRSRRRALGPDQRTLAERVGGSRRWIGEAEHGKPGAGLGLVLRTLAELGVTLSVPDGGPRVGAPPIVGPAINAMVEAARRR